MVTAEALRGRHASEVQTSLGFESPQSESCSHVQDKLLPSTAYGFGGLNFGAPVFLTGHAIPLLRLGTGWAALRAAAEQGCVCRCRRQSWGPRRARGCRLPSPGGALTPGPRPSHRAHWVSVCLPAGSPAAGNKRVGPGSGLGTHLRPQTLLIVALGGFAGEPHTSPGHCAPQLWGLRAGDPLGPSQTAAHACPSFGQGFGLPA